MSVEQNKAAVKRFYDEVVNQARMELIDDLVAPNFIEHEQFPGLGNDREGLKQFFQMMRTAFPDLRIDAHDLLAEGDKVVARATMSGTHQGEFMGVPATGRKISVAVVDLVQFEQGKAVAHWGLTDTMSMLQQLGVMPQE